MPKVIDMSAVIGAKIFCDDVPATDLRDRPLTVEAEFAPKGWSGKHIHPHQDETFVVRSGLLDVLVDAQWRQVQEGESVRIPKGTVHGWRNSSVTPARATNAHDPGLRTQEYWERIENLIRQGKVTGMSGLRNGIYLSLNAMQFRRELVITSPPDWFLRALATLGTALGYKLA